MVRIEAPTVTEGGQAHDFDPNLFLACFDMSHGCFFGLHPCLAWACALVTWPLPPGVDKDSWSEFYADRQFGGQCTPTGQSSDDKVGNRLKTHAKLLARGNWLRNCSRSMISRRRRIRGRYQGDRNDDWNECRSNAWVRALGLVIRPAQEFLQGPKPRSTALRISVRETSPKDAVQCGGGR